MVSSTCAGSCAGALKSSGGQGLLYWEPEGYSPFTGYSMGAWNSSTREPTAAMNGFTAV